MTKINIKNEKNMYLMDTFKLYNPDRENTVSIVNENDYECLPHSIYVDRRNVDIFNVDVAKYQKSEYKRIFNLNSPQVINEPKFAAEPSYVEKSSDTESVKNESDDDNLLVPKIYLILSFFLPFIGCLSYLFNLQYDASTKRGRYTRKALCVGSTLSVVYSFFICSFLARYIYISNPEHMYGFTY
ncbi:conserved protein, unknown function [Hepatocystis sp. ex Piliocolobus tephrosceles]|nr:conserved protein, unknown function [Hepatocystis sp. ex Piliocolobus tephrosceles]